MKKIIALSLLLVPAIAAPLANSDRPCIWPACAKPVIVADIQPCIWPKCERPVLVDFGVRI